MALFKKAATKVKNSVNMKCTFVNDTPYQVSLYHRDGSSLIVIPETLKPGYSQDKSLSKHVETTVVMTFARGKAVRIKFPSSRYERRRVHAMSVVCKEEIENFKSEKDDELPDKNLLTEIIKNAIIKSCTFENNTLYQVLVVDYDGTHPLNPGDSQKNILVKGLGVNLVMKFEHGEVNIRFPSRRYENRRHMMSVVFKDEIQKLERNETDSKTKDDEHPGLVDDQPLTVDDLRDVINATATISDWSTLAIELNIPFDVVDRIEREHQKIKDRQRNLLTHWLDNRDSSWAKLVNALKSQVVSKIELADQIAKDHPGVSEDCML